MRIEGISTEETLSLPVTNAVTTDTPTPNDAVIDPIGLDDALPLEAADEKLRRQNLELNLAYAIEQAISSAEEIPLLVTQVLERTQALLRVEVAAALIEDGLDARIYAVSRVGALAPRAVSHEGAARAIVHSRTPIRRVADANGSVADLLAEPLGATVSETFSAPLADGRTQIGVLQIINPWPRGDSEETTLRRLGLLAAQLGRGIVLRREREANERAKRLAMLGDAMALVAHDVRSPLMAAGEVLQGLVGEDGRAARELAAGRAKRALEQVEHTVEDVLSFARGRREVAIRQVNLESFVERMREMLSPELAACSATLEIHDEYRGPARFDENKWQRVIWNLMRHACLAGADKFVLRISREGELLVFGCVYTGENVRSVVEHQLIELLEPSGASEVAGFGLALARKIVDAHCGRIHVQSHAPNGTVFRIEIPI